MGQSEQLRAQASQLEQLEAQNQQFMAQLEAQNQRFTVQQERSEEQIRHLATLVDHRSSAASVPSEGLPPDGVESFK